MLNLALLAIALGVVSANSCSFIAGNHYCDETKLVQFENVGFSSSYNRVTAFNNDGTCSYTPYSFSGSLAPFNEELSVHFRGPIQLEHFKVFTKDDTLAVNQKRDVHQLHHRHADPEPMIVTATNYYTEFVTAVAEDTAVPAAPSPVPVSESALTVNIRTTSPEQLTLSYTPLFDAPTTSSSSSADAAPTSSSTTSSSTIRTKSRKTTKTSSDFSSSSSAPAPPPTSLGNWTLSADYNAGAGSADGVVFLNNLGGAGSGVFDFTFGNSLSYCAADGINAASNPEVLSQTVVGSNHEFAIFSDSKCSGDDCGFHRPGTVAYHGFGGANKVFIFEFAMPSDNSVGFNADMPAVWLLNAQIPRNLQYGAPSCSCWTSGCGELDLWEILNTGNHRLVTTLHGKEYGGGGSANYFNRPTQGTLKGAAIFTDTTISVVQIPEIPTTIDDVLIQSWIDQAGTASTVSM